MRKKKSLLSVLVYHRIKLEKIYLVVTSDDDDADASSTAVYDGFLDLLTGRVQHANNTHKGHVGL